jgi:uncharacterized membrane protein
MVLEFIFRWAHVLFGMVWVGMLYYFNFVQTEYFKEAAAEARADVMAKLAPRALWWFRWAAVFTLLTGLYLLHAIGATNGVVGYSLIWMGALTGILMFLNAWLIIWPNQQIVLGMKSGEGPVAAARAGLASRTNTLFSGPMLLGMLGSKHLILPGVSATGLIACIFIILLLEANALFGKMGPMGSIAGVIHCSLGLTVLLGVLLAFL